jgi:hypothetical protein
MLNKKKEYIDKFKAEAEAKRQRDEELEIPSTGNFSRNYV